MSLAGTDFAITPALSGVLRSGAGRSGWPRDISDPSELDGVLLARLRADGAAGGLMTLMPDGVYMDVAPSGATQFVIVSLVIAEDDYIFEGLGWERSLYLVKAVDLNKSGLAVKAADARIHMLLQDVPLTLSEGTHMLTRRVERVRYTEVDPDDPDTRWQHRGARYEVFWSPT